MGTRPISEICHELALTAELHGQQMLAYLLRMTSLEAAEAGIEHSDGNLHMFGIEPKEAAAG